MKNINEINRLKWEEFLWGVFAFIAILNIIGDKNEELYIKTKETSYENRSNKIFEITLIVTLLIYIYFFIRNYNAFKNSSFQEKKTI